jgi:hypothetical protein
LADVPIRSLKSDRLVSISAHFFGVSDWMGITSLEEKHTTDSDHRLKSFTVHVESPQGESISIPGGRRLELSAYWSTAGEPDQRSILTPTALTCSARRPRTAWQLYEPILRTQDLLSLCFRGFMVASGGRAIPDLVPGTELTATPELWIANLMTAPGGVPTPGDRGFPIMSLKELGGISALKRWFVLGQKHLRAVRPLIEPYRQGKASSPLRIMELAAAMEY